MKRDTLHTNASSHAFFGIFSMPFTITPYPRRVCTTKMIEIDRFGDEIRRLRGQQKDLAVTSKLQISRISPSSNRFSPEFWYHPTNEARPWMIARTKMTKIGRALLRWDNCVVVRHMCALKLVNTQLMHIQTDFHETNSMKTPLNMIESMNAHFERMRTWNCGI